MPDVKGFGETEYDNMDQFLCSYRFTKDMFLNSVLLEFEMVSDNRHVKIEFETMFPVRVVEVS